MGSYVKKDLVGALRSYGVVATSHRLKMASFLMDDQGSCDSDDGNDWYRASRIYSALLEEGYFISLSSVYKNLCLFRSMGWIDPDGRDL